MTGQIEQPLHGHGAQKLELKVRDNRVVLTFERPAEWLALDPPVAVALAKQLLDAAVNCGYDIVVEAPRPKVPNALRERMHARCQLLLRSKREGPEADRVLSIRIVDTLLNILAL